MPELHPGGDPVSKHLAEMRARQDMRVEAGCPHANLEPHAEPWCDERHVGLGSDEIRRRWPRRRCPDCGAVCYDSFSHYTGGDW